MKTLVSAAVIAAGSFAISFTTPVGAQNYPAKPVRMIIGFTPGTTVDILGRLLAQKLGEAWGQRVVADNLPGASSTIAAAAVARAPADGHTMMFASTGFIVSESLYKKLPYDGIRDFEPVTLVATVPNVLVVHPTLPVKDIRELIALAKARPGELNYAHSGLGSASHLNTELFKAMARVDIVPVSYKSSGQALVDVMSGEVLLNYPSLAAVLPHVKARRVKPLAVSGAKRSQALPAVPAMAEYLPGYEASGWYGVIVPARTPAAIVTRLNQDIVRILKTPDVNELMTRQGAEVVGSTPAEFSEIMREGRRKWAKLIQDLKIPVR